MPRPLALLALLATAACAPATRPLAPVAAEPSPVPQTEAAPQAPPRVTLRLRGPTWLERDGMPVIVPDTTRLEPMPVFRPDTMIDRAMVARYGRTFTVRGPARIAPVNPTSDSLPKQP